MVVKAFLKYVSFIAVFFFISVGFAQQNPDGSSAVPILILPVNGSIDLRADTLSFKWSSDSLAEEYVFQLSTNQSFSTFVANYLFLADTTTIVIGLQNLTEYFWRVGASNAEGFDVFSAVDSFMTIVAVPNPPQLISPNNVVTPRIPVLVWHPSTYATKYHLQVAKDNKFASVVVDTTVRDTTIQILDTLTASIEYYWHVNAIDKAGEGRYSTTYWFKPVVPVEIKSRQDVPNEFYLSQNYPNPFNPTTVINYQLPVISHVSLKVYDFLGREVETLVNGRQSAGNYSARFNGANLSSGVYFYGLEAGAYHDTKKFLLLK